MSRTSDRVCMLELNTDMTRIVCSKCGWEVPAGTNPNTVRECGGCERVVVYGDIPRLYLIGPVTGKPNDNRETFRAVRAILRKDGYECDCPHHFIEQGTEWGKAMRTSIRQMLANDGQSTIPLYDGIAMLDGWERSRGAKIEHDIAEALGMPCRPWREWLSPRSARSRDGGRARTPAAAGTVLLGGWTRCPWSATAIRRTGSR